MKFQPKLGRKAYQISIKTSVALFQLKKVGKQYSLHEEPLTLLKKDKYYTVHNSFELKPHSQTHNVYTSPLNVVSILLSTNQKPTMATL